MACSNPFTFSYWFSRLRTRQKQLSPCPQEFYQQYKRGCIMGKLYNDMRPHKLCLDPGSLHEIELYLSTVSRTPHDSHIKVLCIKKIGLWKERGLRSMFFIWFITSWAHTFIIASAVAITWQALWTQSKHIEIYHDTNGSLAKPTHWYSLSLRLCSWPELHVSL